ncbi:hypothetical protein FQU76_12635 [Streptomyces qinzhouensis]|uniref:Uncharacterized protein n=1 Tax=Streptomyces qinzhouensis TaxID=2599401 RepID=A0A5B8J9Y0_9ACTN|nr:hypothetical protein FQU76_12635 [Streptomyces qinzhouensis]
MTAERGRVLHRAAGSDVNHSRDGRGSQDLAPLPPGVRAGPGEAEGRRAGGPQSAEKNGGASCQILRSPTSATDRAKPSVVGPERGLTPSRSSHCPFWAHLGWTPTGK